VPSVRQFSARITDLVAAWEDATPDQRSRLASSRLAVTKCPIHTFSFH